MGRRPDPPALQAAKGNPGKRKSKVAQRLEMLANVAALLATAPLSPADGEAPAIFNEPEWSPALAVWRRNAPELARTNRLTFESRDYFAALCVYTAAWWSYGVQIAREGETQRVKRTNGSYELKVHPAVTLREAAFDNMMKLAPKFGMTPLDMYGLYKDQAAAVHSNPGLFGRDDQPKAAAADAPAAPGAGGGLFTAKERLRSAPPAGRA